MLMYYFICNNVLFSAVATAHTAVDNSAPTWSKVTNINPEVWRLKNKKKKDNIGPTMLTVL